MPKYGKRSTNNLNEAHEDLQIIFTEVIKYFDNSIICGHRGEEAQMKAYNGKKSKVKWPDSKHNKIPSEAVDAVPYPINWKDVNRMRYFAGHVVMCANMLFDAGLIKHRVRTGLDWDKDTQVNDQSFIDAPHFELYIP